jgi:hypothetical protein
MTPTIHADDPLSVGPPYVFASFDELFIVVRVCQVIGVTGLCCGGYCLAADSRPSKVISKALSAAFQRLDQRLRPVPLGSGLITAR